jgi:molecular chaperone HscA
VMATKKALEADGDLLSEEERKEIEGALAGLEQAIKGDKATLIQARTDQLDDATHAWAGRRMDRAVAKAIAGKQVDAVESTVAEARGVDAHVAEHAERAAAAAVPAVAVGDVILGEN